MIVRDIVFLVVFIQVNNQHKIRTLSKEKSDGSVLFRYGQLVSKKEDMQWEEVL